MWGTNTTYKVTLGAQAFAPRPLDPRAVVQRDLDELFGLIASAAWAKAVERGWRLAHYHRMLAEFFSLTGYAHDRLGQRDRALQAHMAALVLDPGHADFLTNIAVQAQNHGDLPLAERLYRRALVHRQNHASAHVGVGACAGLLGRKEDLRRHSLAAVVLEPATYIGYYNLGTERLDAGAYEDAEGFLLKALALEPNSAQANFNIAKIYLMRFDYRKGLPLLAWRKATPDFGADYTALQSPAWRGQDGQGRHMLVLAEQGFGDTIQFSRYLRLIAARGFRVTLQGQRAMGDLMARLGAIAAWHDGAAPSPDHDVHVWLMDTPAFFELDPARLPPPDPALDLFRDLAPKVHGRPHRIGVVWRGNPRHSNDHNRSMPVDALRPLASLRDVSWFTFQLDAREEELTASLPMTPALAPNATWIDTARALRGMDLLISVDTSVAHLAGTMGVPTWLLLPPVPDWRWGAVGTSSPWYSSLRLFRRGLRQTWPALMNDVALRLSREIEAP